MSSRHCYCRPGGATKIARALVLVAALTLNACGGGSGSGGPDEGNQVAPPSIATIAVSPAEVTLEALGATLQIEATARDGNGNPLAAQFSWSSADAAVATVSAGGLVTASDNGMTSVTVRSGTVAADVAVTVEQKPASITLSHDESMLTAPGGNLQLEAKITDANDHAISAELIWESSEPAVATVNAEGLVTARRSGVVAVTATVRDQDPSVTATVEVTVRFRPLTVTGDPNVRDSRNGRTLLHVAAMANATDMIRALVAAGADIEARDYHSRTPLHAAARGDAPAAVEVLVKLGADLDALNRFGQTPLQYAASLGSLLYEERIFALVPEAVAALLAAGADPNRRNQELSCRAPLHSAALSAASSRTGPGAMAAVLALLEGGADPNLQTCDFFMVTPLRRATRGDNPALIAALLEAGADPGARSAEGRTPLNQWARNQVHEWIRAAGYLAILAELLEAGADVDARGTYGETALYLAAKYDNATAVAALLEAGADPGARDTRGRTPLHAAAIGGSSTIPRVASAAAIAVLLDAGSDPNARDNAGLTALEAAVPESAALIAVLLDAHAGQIVNDPNARDGYGYAPLHAAARANSPKLIAALVEAGAELDARDNYYDHTPLLMASGATREFGWTPTIAPAAIRALLKAGADPDAVDRNGHTAFQHGLEKGRTAVIAELAEAEANREGSNQREFMALFALAARDPNALSSLVAAGTNPDARDAEGYTVLHRAMAWEDSVALAALAALAESGADLNAQQGTFGDTPLHLAVSTRRPTLVAALLEAGADPARPGLGGTALHRAASTGRLGAIALLLAAGADPAPVDRVAPETPLHSAAATGQPRAIAALLEAWADPDARDDYGRTPLHLAATPITEWNRDLYAAAVAILLEARADPDVTDNNGNTPLDLATMEGEESSVALLRAFGM